MPKSRFKLQKLNGQNEIYHAASSKRNSYCIANIADRPQPWQREVLQWMDTELKEGMTFLDIGANVGYYTLLGARLVAKSGKVIALEPDPDPSVATILRTNFKLNSLERVRVVQGAACATRGIVRFGRSGSA